MPTRFRRPLLVVAALVVSAGGASAQGYTVRTWGYFDPVPYPPLTGGTYSYTIGGRPMVTLQDPWGRIVDMPLQPKVLYYDTPFLTTQGWYRPISIAVMPEARPRTYVPPIPRAEQMAPAVTPPPPVARSTVLPDLRSTRAIPTVPVIPPRAEQPGPGPPAVPNVPELPTVPKLPGTDAGPAIPKLGPAPQKDK